jgi:GNAT superfamily N-acetyltransferase
MRLTDGREIVIELLTKSHNRTEFDCEEESLNRYLKEAARQNSRRHIGQTYVAVVAGEKRVVGYYTVCAGRIAFETLPPSSQNLPPYPIPTLHLARLAVDRSLKGLGLGRLLLFEALKLAARWAGQVGVYAVDVLALNDSARHFYLKHGFIELQDEKSHLLLPVKDVLALQLE